MVSDWKWNYCVAHSGHDVITFVNEYFSNQRRRVLLICGAGFDPRSTTIPTRLCSVGANIRAVLIREERPDPDAELVYRAENNERRLSVEIADHEIVSLEVFESDLAVIGGRNVVRVLSQQAVEEFTDVIVDISALSVGISFPIIRYLVERSDLRSSQQNLHLFVVHSATLDDEICSTPNDTPSYVHGFKGRLTLDESASSIKMWLPHLASGKRAILRCLHDFVSPEDTCPVVPFPASKPRLGDILAEEYMSEIESGWSVDARDIVYADESDPLDLYRTILRLDDLRKPVFQEVGGSILVLSPVGSKVMALGALMAALERDLPVVHIESIGYNLRKSAASQINDSLIIHIWLEGDIYPPSTTGQ